MFIMSDNRKWIGGNDILYLYFILVAITVLGFVDVSLSAEKLLEIRSGRVVEVRDALPGDTLFVPDGTYNDVVIKLESSGVSGKPIFVKAKTPGKVILKGASAIKILSDYNEISGFKFEQVTDVNNVEFVGAKHSRLTDCAFVDCSAPRYSDPRIITLKGDAQFNRVDHCFMQGNTSIGMGVTVQDGDKNNIGNKFDHNYFKDFVKTRDNVQEAIQIGQLNFNLGYYANAVVEFNLFDDVSGEGEHGEIISNKSSGNIYRYNTFRNCQGSLSLRTGADCTVENNWFFDVGEGLKVFGNGHKIFNNYFEGGNYGVWLPSGTGRGQGTSVGLYEAPDNCVVAGNSFFNCTIHAIYLGQGLGTTVTYENKKFTRSYQPRNCKIYNNILLGKTEYLLSLYNGVRSDENDFKSNILSPSGGSKTGYTGKGVSLANISFGRGDECYRINVSSQNLLEDKGVDVEGLLSDIDGQVREGHPDIGSDEFVIGVSLHTPLSVSDVGPTWMRATTRLLPIQNLKISR